MNSAKKKYANLNATLACKGVRTGDHLGWRALETIQKGTRAHHREPDALALQNPETKTVATTKAENVKIVKDYCTKLYNCTDATVDPKVLEEISQRPIEQQLGNPPTNEDIHSTIKRMKNNKALGESRVTAEALKAISGDSLTYLTIMVQHFWNKINNENFEEWNTAVLKLLHKKGTKKAMTKNYRGLALQDMTARLMSLIIAERLNKLIKKNGLHSQFASVGTANAHFVLRTALQLRREHRLDSHVLFVDLVKAIDTANHELLFELLKNMEHLKP